MLTESNIKHSPASIQKPSYERKALKTGIVHFGVGNFFRAHEAFYVDQLLKTDPRWGIVGVGLRDNDSAREKAKTFQQQDGLYSFTEADPKGDFSTRIIGVLKEYLLAPQNPQAVLDVLISPDVHLVSMTVTEGGYPYNSREQHVKEDDPALLHDCEYPDKPHTAFGYIVAACKLRKERGLKGFTVLSCDNFHSNGRSTKQIVLFLARRNGNDLSAWIEENVTFPDSMVDRITPTVTPERKKDLNQKSGLDDAVPVMAESFTQWVIEDQFPYPRPAFETVGVQLVQDTEPYEAVKTRMLNASHTMLSYSACLLGYEYIDEALSQEPLIEKLLEDFWNKDVIPNLQAPEDVSLENYRDTLMERYLNAAVKDQNLRVASDAASKIPVFFGPTVKALLKRNKPLERVAYAMASYLEYLQGVDEKKLPFTPLEPTFEQQDWEKAKSSDLKEAFKVPAFRAWQDVPHEQLNERIVHYREALRRNGVRQTLETLFKDHDLS